MEPNFNGTYIWDYNETKLNNMMKNETKDSDLPYHTTDPRGGGGGGWIGWNRKNLKLHRASARIEVRWPIYRAILLVSAVLI
jgi:hypothetical protein